MKTELTIEESAKLIELGVDAKLASMVSWKQTENWQRKSVLGDKEHLQLKPFRPMVMGFERFDCKDIFTLTDLLSILPKEIDGNVISIISTGFNPKTEELDKGWTATYVTDHFIPVFGDNVVFSAPELIDALNSLLIWCLEQGHCKCGKGGGK